MHRMCCQDFQKVHDCCTQSSQKSYSWKEDTSSLYDQALEYDCGYVLSYSSHTCDLGQLGCWNASITGVAAAFPFFLSLLYC